MNKQKAKQVHLYPYQWVFDVFNEEAEKRGYKSAQNYMNVILTQYAIELKEQGAS